MKTPAHRLAAMRKYVHALRAAGKCVRCRCPNPTPQRWRCPDCSKAQTRAVRKHERKQRERGLCVRCTNPSPAKKVCTECVAKHRIYMQGRKA